MRDKNGNKVVVGSMVKIVEIPQLDSYLDSESLDRVSTMLNEVFEVYEIDNYNRAWVEKWWGEGDGKSVCHSLALEQNHFIVVGS